ncbi:MAG: glycosyltransferase family 4 protein [Candidatus Cloacimonetes bacterium]|nr:glycosyltransferase family 4 protein [Candidatus Cloacimonadota bacterium]
MKVLFVSSGNSASGISPIIKAQGESLLSLGVSVSYFAINGQGIGGYLKNVWRLKTALMKEQYDVVHAHFSLSGFVASLAGASPLVVSLMGWNVQKPLLRFFIHVFNKFSWDACIVKSQKMKDSLGIKKVLVIPNGVDMNHFHAVDKKAAQDYLGWDDSKIHILCAADPKRPIKNIGLAREAYDRIKTDLTELHFLENVGFDEMVYFYNASDVVFLTSKAEGSPNVIKEALACNCKVVSTDVGDVAERFGDNPACFITEHEADNVASKLVMALNYQGEVNTRKLVQHLDAKSIAQEIVQIYAATRKANRK